MRPTKHTLTASSHSSTVTRIQKINVLVVISSDKAAELIRSLFTQLGFSSIFIAVDAADAVRLLRELRIHLIVTDSELKVNPQEVEHSGGSVELSGIHFVQRLRHAPMSPAAFTPVLMLMDSARSHQLHLARDAGVNEIVLRPMQAKDFCERIIQMIDKPRAFITAPHYKGPCRRRAGGPPPGVKERRVRDIRVIRCDEMKGGLT